MTVQIWWICDRKWPPGQEFETPTLKAYIVQIKLDF